MDHAAHQDDRWMFVALFAIGMITIFFPARYFIRKVAELQRKVVSTRMEFEQHLKTANVEMVAALTRSTEVIAHNSATLDQLQRKLMAYSSRNRGIIVSTRLSAYTAVARVNRVSAESVADLRNRSARPMRMNGIWPLRRQL